MECEVAAPGGDLVATIISAYLSHLQATTISEYHDSATRTMHDFCDGLPALSRGIGVYVIAGQKSHGRLGAITDSILHPR